MSAPSPPPSAGDQVFRFISDPSHKENLSGRVRAACLTCRRKKIKCSGELNCRTCREKGLVCEGLPERKRPARDSTSSITLGPVPSGIDRKRRTSVPKRTSLRRASAALIAIECADGHDSNYFSNPANPVGSLASPTTSTAPFNPILETKPAFRVASQPAKSKPRPSKSVPDLRVDTWNLTNQQSHYMDGLPHDQIEMGPQSCVSAQAEVAGFGFSHSPLSWPHLQQPIDWWPTQPKAGEQHLLIPTQGSMAQGQIYPQAPNDQQPAPNQGELSPRQTTAYPLPSQDIFEPRYDIPQNHYGIVDDMALMVTNRTPGMGLTPKLAELSSWWDLNGVGDFATAFETGNPMMPLTVNDSTQQPPPAFAPVEEAQNLQTGQGGLRRPADSDGSYFPWPD